MTARFAVRSVLRATLLLIASSTTGQAQQIVNLTPAPPPAGPHHYKGGAQIIVQFGTNPAAAWVEIKCSWNVDPSNWYSKPNGGFSTELPYLAGFSTITAPTYDFGNPNKIHTITVKVYPAGGGPATDTKTINIKVDPPQ